ncbi:MAG: holo-ACP synthase [Planctomycetia bacterium]|nr:holo-ACP synthase [Planctomycetia bacterium]
MNIIGIGTDITEISRIDRMTARHADYFLHRVFTDAELAYSLSAKRSGERLAGRWAAKEAVLKALGTGWAAGISWQDVEVTRDASGKPDIRLHGAAQKVADSLGISHIFISISHCDCHAIAYAIAVSQ